MTGGRVNDDRMCRMCIHMGNVYYPCEWVKYPFKILGIYLNLLFYPTLLKTQH